MRNIEKTYELAVSLLEHSHRYSWIILAQPGVIGLRNLDHLFENKDSDLLISYAETGEPVDSFYALRSEILPDFLAAWEGVLDGPVEGESYLAAIMETRSFRVKTFERGEVVRPFEGPLDIRDLMEAAVVDLSGGKPEEQTKLAFALHMMRTFGDKDGIFLDLLES